MVCITEEERRGNVEIFRKIGHIDLTPEELAEANDGFYESMARHLGISLEEVKRNFTPVE